MTDERRTDATTRERLDELEALIVRTLELDRRRADSFTRRSLTGQGILLAAVLVALILAGVALSKAGRSIDRVEDRQVDIASIVSSIQTDRQSAIANTCRRDVAQRARELDQNRALVAFVRSVAPDLVPLAEETFPTASPPARDCAAEAVKRAPPIDEILKRDEAGK